MESNQSPVDESQELVSDKVEKKETTLSEGEQRYKNDLIRYKQEARELKEQLEAIELEKQQKKGNYQGVIQKLKADLEETKKSSEKMRYNFANTKLNDALRLEAAQKGIKGQQLDVFMRLIDEDSKAIVEFDDKFNVKSEDVSTVVESTLKRYSDVFKNKVNVVDGVPNQKPLNKPEKKVDISKMSAAEYKDWVIANKDKFDL